MSWLHFSKVQPLSKITEFGITTFFKEEQPEIGKATDDNSEQPEKALLLIDVSERESVTLVRPEHPEKAASPIETTE